MRSAALALALALLLATGAPAEGSHWRGPIRLTWYGSDYFGRRTACGQRYTRSLAGVATWLPLRCGTLVRLRWKKRTVTVPVVDRLPKHPWVVFDATAKVACDLLNPPRLKGVCFTRSGVYWRVVR